MADINITNDENGNFDIRCSVCGEPISVVDEFGMFCKNLCGREESVKAQEQYGNILNQIMDNTALMIEKKKE